MNFTQYRNAKELLLEEDKLKLPSADIQSFIEIGKIAMHLGFERKLPIAVQVQYGNWMIFHASLPGSINENQQWLDRKARVVLLKHHSTMYERVSATERGVDWFKENDLTDATHAIHGGGLPLITQGDGFMGFC